MFKRILPSYLGKTRPCKGGKNTEQQQFLEADKHGL